MVLDARAARPSKADRFPEIVPQVELDARPSHANGTATTAGNNRFSTLVQAAASVRCTQLSFSNIHLHGDLFCDYLRARHDVFIDGKGWNLPEEDGMEFDQYDTAYARWIVLHEYGRVVGGVRLYPTDKTVGMHSYMLRDAQLGLLEGLRKDFLYLKAPVSPLVWEATRLFLTRDVASQRRLPIQFKLMSEMARVAREEGAAHVIGIMPAVFRRWLARLGMSALPMGPEGVTDGERVCAALFRAEEFKH
jgi:N-acyl-L-homoserine lactone synthetase